MGVILAAGWLPPGWPEGIAPLLVALGAVVSLLGAALTVWAWRTLDRSASPYPRPRHGGRLIEGGPYAYVRHPIYAGGLLFFVGYALATSPAALVPLVALALLWRAKAALEERMLAARYDDYEEYRARVPGAFVPTRLPREH